MSSFDATDPHRTFARATLAACLCLAVSWAAAGEADAQMYECNQGGQISFSDQPCAGQERRIDVQYEQPGAEQVKSAQEKVGVEEAAAGAVAEALELDGKILSKEQEISRLQTERDAQVAELRQQVLEGTEELDRNAWQAQMTQRIASVYEDYNDRILAAQAELNALQSQRAALPGPGSANP